jgi:hypothetical protein
MAFPFSGSDEGRQCLYGNEYAGSGTGRRGPDARQDVDLSIQYQSVPDHGPDVVFELDRTRDRSCLRAAEQVEIKEK